MLGFDPATTAMSNGSTELITWLGHLSVRGSIAVPIPTFGLDVDTHIKFIRSCGSRVAVLCNPNNPDGGYLPRREVIRFMDELADLDLVAVDAPRAVSTCTRVGIAAAAVAEQGA